MRTGRKPLRLREGGKGQGGQQQNCQELLHEFMHLLYSLLIVITVALINKTDPGAQNYQIEDQTLVQAGNIAGQRLDFLVCQTLGHNTHRHRIAIIAALT